jgi:hypothetical protein
MGESYVYGRYRIAYCVPDPINGERANFAVLLWGDDYPLRVRTLNDWSRFEAFTGWERARCEEWLKRWSTPDALEAWAHGEKSGSTGQMMSCLQFTVPAPAALNATPDMLADLAKDFLPERTKP